MGPEAGLNQSASVARKIAARLPDISGAPSLAGRIVLFTSYVSSLFSFTGQFADPDSETKKRYDHAV